MSTPDTNTPGTGTPAPTPGATPTVEELTAQLNAALGERDEWKGHARTWETRAKDNAAERDQFKAKLPEADQAVESARQAARLEAATEFAGRLVDAEIKAATAGRGVDVEALTENLDRRRFVNDDGTVKSADIAAWVDRVAPKPSTDGAPPAGTVARVDLGQGAPNGGTLPLNGDPLIKALNFKLGISA